MRLVLAGILVALATGCASSPMSMPKELHDSSGRSCMIDLADISATSTCDVDPATVVMGCAGGSVACFTVTPDSMTNALRNCGACCDAARHSTTIVSSTCALVTCTTDADCLYGNARCTSGMCGCPEGFCH